jgi:hypothetical protein
VFHRELEYDLRPILDTAADQAHVRSWIQAMLVRHGHAAELPYEAQTAT